MSDEVIEEGMCQGFKIFVKVNHSENEGDLRAYAVPWFAQMSPPGAALDNRFYTYGDNPDDLIEEVSNKIKERWGDN